MRYDYDCPECGEIELVHGMNDSFSTCPYCSSEIVRIFSIPVISIGGRTLGTYAERNNKVLGEEGRRQMNEKANIDRSLESQFRDRIVQRKKDDDEMKRISKLATKLTTPEKVKDYVENGKV